MLDLLFVNTGHCYIFCAWSSNEIEKGMKIQVSMCEGIYSLNDLVVSMCTGTYQSNDLVVSM